MTDSIEVQFGEDVPYPVDLHWCEAVSPHAWQAYCLSVRLGVWDVGQISALLDRPREHVYRYKAEIDRQLARST